MVLIVSTPQDVHAQAVQRALQEMGVDVMLVDLSQFPQNGALTIRAGATGRSDRIRLGTDSWLDLSDCRAVWWRRPQAFTLHPQIDRSRFRQFTYNECMEAWSGLWQSLRADTLWVNDLNQEAAANHKVYQLRVAQDVGLTIPETCITNDVAAAQTFINQQNGGKVIYKAFSATPEHWRETRLLRAEERHQLENVRFAPVIFQEYIDAVFDVRITIIGNEIFAAAIHSQETEYRVDFRMEMDRARIEAIELPAGLQEKLLRFMRKLGLEYGAIDMRQTPAGEWIFFEVNPAGQYLFIEQKTQQPITQTLARHLAQGKETG